MKWIKAFAFFGILSLILVNFVWPYWNYGGILSCISIAIFAFCGVMIFVQFDEKS